MGKPVHFKRTAKLHITLVAAGGHGPFTASEARRTAFSEIFAERGWEVKVTAGTPSDTSIRVKPPRPSRVSRSVMFTGRVFGVEGDVQPAAIRNVRLQPEECTRFAERKVILLSVPPFSLLGLIGWFKKRGYYTVIDYRDPFAAAGRPSPLARLLRPAEARLLGHSDLITYAGSEALGRGLSRLTEGGAPVLAVQDGIDVDDLPTLEPQHRQGDSYSLIFAGSLYANHRLRTIVAANAKIRSERLRLIVAGPVDGTIQDAISKRHGQIRFVAPQSRASLYELVSSADAGLVELESRFPWPTAYPIKVYEYLALSLPIIAVAPRGAALADLVPDDQIRWFRPGDVDALSSFLTAQLRAPDFLGRRFPPLITPRSEGATALAIYLERALTRPPRCHL